MSFNGFNLINNELTHFCFICHMSKLRIGSKSVSLLSDWNVYHYYPLKGQSFFYKSLEYVSYSFSISLFNFLIALINGFLEV